MQKRVRFAALLMTLALSAQASSDAESVCGVSDHNSSQTDDSRSVQSLDDGLQFFSDAHRQTLLNRIRSHGNPSIARVKCEARELVRGYVGCVDAPGEIIGACRVHGHQDKTTRPSKKSKVFSGDITPRLMQALLSWVAFDCPALN